MVTILSRQICPAWVAHKRTANAYKRFKDGALFKEKTTEKYKQYQQYLPSLCKAKWRKH